MSFKIEESGPPLTDAEIVGLELELGARLPEQYRQFLLTNNGGIPHPNVGLDIADAPFVGTDVQVFFGTSGPIQSSNLPWWVREMPEHFPEATIPIATDSGDNLFCIVLSGDDYGKVIYLDSQSGYLERTPTKIYAVADSFDEFMGKLREQPSGPFDEIESRLRDRLKTEDIFNPLPFANLPDKERVFMTILTLDRDACSDGGFKHYFLNPASDDAYFAPTAFRVLGEPEMADIVQRALDLFGPEGPPREQDARKEALEKLTADTKSELDSLSDELRKHCEKVHPLLERYAREHLDAPP